MRLSSCTALLGELHGKSVLVVGTGGGCDIISAYAVAHLLKEAEAGTIVYANIKRYCEDELELVTSRVFRVPARIRPLRHGCEAHGTTLIEHTTELAHRCRCSGCCLGATDE